MSAHDQLLQFIQANPELLVITGAGCSSSSGIPTYRDAAGTWLRSTPIQHQDFVNDASQRRRYWARSLAGWPAVERAQPNPAHRALAELESLGICQLLVTQNVDRLHQKAGHSRVVDLHGRLDRVQCLQCGQEIERSDMQQRILALNPELDGMQAAALAPDGDATVEDWMTASIQVPACDTCGGVLKPTVVFYGGSVAKGVVESIYETLQKVRGLLVIGSSLMVFSSYRFSRRANNLQLPIAAVNEGMTRADDLLSLKLKTDCTALLPAVVRTLAS